MGKDKSCNNKHLERLLEEYSKYPQEATDNPFAAWGMSENDHTKLLVALLKCVGPDCDYPVLSSFLARFTGLQCDELKKVKATFNQACGNGYIDGYITFESNGVKYALVIENKVYDAPDQPNQVKRYIEHALKDIKGNAEDALLRIWALYITRDGSKTVCKHSYSIENPDPSTDLGDRFVEINYKEHIIDWISTIEENALCPESARKVANVYLEYLVNEFRNKQNLYHREKFLLDAMNIPKNLQQIEEQHVKDLYDLRHEIQKFRKKSKYDIDNEAFRTISSALSEVLLKLEKFAFDKFEEVTKTILDEWAQDKGLKWKVAHRGVGGDSGYLQIRLVDEWGSAHMEWEPIGVVDMLFAKEYQFALHLEGHRDLRKSWVEELKTYKDLPKDGHISTSSRLFKWTINTEKPFCQMGESELKEALTKYYITDANRLFLMLIDRLSEYNKNENKIQ